MKNYFALILIFVFEILNLSVSGKADRAYIEPFQITSRKPNSYHSDGSTIINLTFKKHTGIVMENISVGINDSTFFLQSNEKGLARMKVKEGKYKFYFLISGYEEIITDSIEIKANEWIDASVYFDFPTYMITPAKPVIYLYPKEEMNVKVDLQVMGKLGFTYPTYNNGWHLSATPNGEIKINNHSYNYLFWESEMPKADLKYDNTGFLVSTDTLLSFLENSLAQFGLTSKESADFITYWYPQMIKNNTNHIHFLLNDACDTYATLTITPAPQHIFRIGMLWSEAKNNFIPDKQIITPIHREGFTVIEWGGVVMNQLFEKEN